MVLYRDRHPCRADTMNELPQFKSPPVSEVACTLQLSDALQIRTIDFATVAEAFANEYPVIEEHPPLPPISVGGQFNFQFGAPFELPRLWMIDRSGNRLVQFQRDRIGVNWRKRADDEEYPRFRGAIRPALLDAYERLLTVTSALGLEAPTFDAFDMTYVNPIALEAGQQLSDVIRPWSGEMLDELGEPIHGVNLKVTFAMPAIDGLMTADAGIATRVEDGSPIVLLQLTVRGRVDDGTFQTALECVDTARQWIVKGFASMTTESMHEKWGRFS